MRAKQDVGGGKNDQEGQGRGRGLPGVVEGGRTTSTCPVPAAEGPPPSPRPPGCRREEMHEAALGFSWAVLHLVLPSMNFPRRRVHLNFSERPSPRRWIGDGPSQLQVVV